MYKYDQTNLGNFENELGNGYTYRPSRNPWGLAHGLPHEVDVLDGTRAAIVKKTVLYIAVDEAADGTPVLEKWHLKKHTQYTN
jgi:hypothetical protein